MAGDFSHFSLGLETNDAIRPQRTAAVMPALEALSGPVRMPSAPLSAIASRTPLTMAKPKPVSGTVAPAPAHFAIDSRHDEADEYAPGSELCQIHYYLTDGAYGTADRERLQKAEKYIHTITRKLFSSLFLPLRAAIFTAFESKQIDYSEVNKIFTDKVLTNGDNINNIYTIEKRSGRYFRIFKTKG